jgi:hypothetical protein
MPGSESEEVDPLDMLDSDDLDLSLDQGEPLGGIDENVVGLVTELNAWPGLFTTSSCGGHPDPVSGQCPEGVWQIYVDLRLDDEERPLLESWLSLEYLAYVCSKRLGGIDLRVFASAPFPNGFGESITFIMTGSGDPQTTADQLVELRAEFEHYLNRQETEEGSFD